MVKSTDIESPHANFLSSSVGFILGLPVRKDLEDGTTTSPPSAISSAFGPATMIALNSITRPSVLVPTTRSSQDEMQGLVPLLVTKRSHMAFSSSHLLRKTDITGLLRAVLSWVPGSADRGAQSQSASGKASSVERPGRDKMLYIAHRINEVLQARVPLSGILSSTITCSAIIFLQFACQPEDGGIQRSCFAPGRFLCVHYI